jgi:hypothetical protein
MKNLFASKKFNRSLWIVTMSWFSLWILYEVTSVELTDIKTKNNSIVRYVQLNDSFYLAESIDRFVAKFDVSKVCFFVIEWFSSSDLRLDE